MPSLEPPLCPRQDLLAYLPRPLQSQVNMATLQSLMDQELRQLKGCSAQEAQIGFIGGSGARGQLGRTKEVETQEGRGESGGLGKLLVFPVPLPSPGGQEGRSSGPRTLIFRVTPPSPEAVSQLPLFGYTVYVVLRASDLTLPRPSLLGLNRQHLILMDPSSQVGWAAAPVRAWAPWAIPLPPPTCTPVRGPSPVPAVPRHCAAPSP